MRAMRTTMLVLALACLSMAYITLILFVNLYTAHFELALRLLAASAMFFGGYIVVRAGDECARAHAHANDGISLDTYGVATRVDVYARARAARTPVAIPTHVPYSVRTHLT